MLTSTLQKNRFGLLAESFRNNLFFVSYAVPPAFQNWKKLAVMQSMFKFCVLWLLPKIKKTPTKQPKKPTPKQAKNTPYPSTLE